MSAILIYVHLLEVARWASFINPLNHTIRVLEVVERISFVIENIKQIHLV